MVERRNTSRGSSFWQIIFPALIGALFVLLLAFWLVAISSRDNLSRFAELSTVLLVIPTVFFSLLILLALGVSIYLVIRLMKVIPSGTDWILNFLDKINFGVTKITQLIVKPIIRPTAFLAGFRRIFSRGNPRHKVEE